MEKDKIDFLEEMGNFVFASRYAKYNNRAKRRETWEESVNRVKKMHLRKYDFLSDADKAEIEWAFDLVKEKRVVPSMRSLQFGGKAIEAKEERMFNCAVRHVDSLRSFSEIFFLLLCGNGVGIGLSDHFLSRLPDLVDKKNKTGSVLTYVVEDTIEGWADAVQALMNCYFKNTPYSGRKVVFDFSKIRPEGSVLKTGGGKAPGYKGLKNALEKIKKHLDHIIEYRNQYRLKSVDAYDILMHCADAVLSGGIRRSATSIIFDINDQEMINSKTDFKVDKVFSFDHTEDKVVNNIVTKIYEGKILFEGEKLEVQVNEFELDRLKKEKLISWRHLFPQRGRSNNSALLVRGECSFDQFKSIVEKTKQYGEPGFVFGVKDQLFNPCQPGWAPVLTKNGIRKMEDISEGDEIWSESGWTKVAKKWSTGVKRVYKYSTNASVFYGTENHKIVSNGLKEPVKEADSIDILSGPFHSFELDPQDIMDGLVIGDGSAHKASNNKVYLFIGKDDFDYFESEVAHLIKGQNKISDDCGYDVETTITSAEVEKTFNREVPHRFFYGNQSKVVGFLRGLYSANGSVVGNRVTLKTSSSKLREQVQIMLSSVGIRSYYTTNKPKSIEFSNGVYETKESYDINITIDREKFVKSIGFIQNYKNDKVKIVDSNRQKTNYDITSIEFVSEEEVFDITVNNNEHTYWTGGCNVSNCFEIGFLPIKDGICGVQFCNLTSINGKLCDTKQKFKEATKASTIIGTLQAGYTNFPYLNNVSEELTRDEALLGCSITGMMENPNILLDPSNQKEMAEYASSINKKWSKKIGTNQAARITCIKPEGSSSAVLGTCSGIHPHHARRYIRRIQMNKMDNIYQYFRLFNDKICEESVWSANKTDDVLMFPIEISDKAIIKKNLSALEHLEIIKNTQQNWVLPGTTDANKKDVRHNVSCTVIVKDEEWDEVEKYIFENKDYFAAVSFIPDVGDKVFPQAPMEEVRDGNEEDEKLWKHVIENFSSVDYKKFKENDDQTSLSQELTCSGGSCEIK